MQTTPLSQETKVACLNGVKETMYKLSDQDLSLLSSHLIKLVGRQLTTSEAQSADQNDEALLQRLDYPER